MWLQSRVSPLTHTQPAYQHIKREDYAEVTQDDIKFFESHVSVAYSFPLSSIPDTLPPRIPSSWPAPSCAVMRESVRGSGRHPCHAASHGCPPQAQSTRCHEFSHHLAARQYAQIQGPTYTQVITENPELMQYCEDWLRQCVVPPRHSLTAPDTRRPYCIV